jgi:hypothetical protein
MTEAQLAISKELIDELDKNEKKPANETLVALQKQATQVQRAEKDAEWEGINTYNQDDIKPTSMAKLYAALPWGPQGTYYPFTICLMLALASRRRRLYPEDGDIYPLPSGKVGTSLQGILKEAELKDKKIIGRKFTEVKRDWPKGLRLPYKDTSVKPWKEGDFALDMEPGVKCEIVVNGEPLEFTCWLTQWYKNTDAWYKTWDNMLRVRSFMRCLSFGTGIAISEENIEVESARTLVEPKEPKAPKETPFAGQK